MLPRLRLRVLPEFRRRWRRRLQRAWRGALDSPPAQAEVGEGVLLQGWALPPGLLDLAAIEWRITVHAADGSLLCSRDCRWADVWQPRVDVGRALGDGDTVGAGFLIGIPLAELPVGRLRIGIEARHPQVPTLWRVEREVIRVISRVTATEPADAAVNLVGLLGSSLGLGTAVRGTARVLTAAGLTVHPIAVDARRGAFGDGRDLIAATTVVQLNPDLLPAWLAAVGSAGWTVRRIAYVVWELPVLPPGWREALALWATEIWCPSRFVRQALIDAGLADGSRRLRCVPHAITPPTPATLRSVQARLVQRLGPLPDQAVVLLSLFDYASDIERKNPRAAIKLAARAAARSDRPLVLVLKTLSAAQFPELARQLARTIARVRGQLDVRLLDGDWPELDLWALIERCDLLISLHRAEGFGLVVAEAMALGKPVLVTDWSGNTDFAHVGNCLPVPARLVPVRAPKTSPVAGPYMAALGAYWARPDQEQALKLLLAALAPGSGIEILARRAQHDIAMQLSPEAIAADALADWPVDSGTKRDGNP